MPLALPNLAEPPDVSTFTTDLSKMMKEQESLLDKLNKDVENGSNGDAIDAAIALLLQKNLKELKEAFEKGGMTLALDKLKELIEKVKKEDLDRETLLNGVDGFVYYAVLARLLELSQEQQGAEIKPPEVDVATSSIRSEIPPLELSYKIG